MSHYVGVDVGTGSVRAAVLKKEEGGLVKLLSTSVKAITIYNDCANNFEQSSQEIWAAVVSTITQVIKTSSISPHDVKGIGFDATCSLVALNKNFDPICISPLHKDKNKKAEREDCRNIIMWMDHRATQEAELINQTNHSLLQFVGGAISVEMEMPKVLWLKKNLPEQWNNIGALMDLPDFLTYKATGATSRSLCSLVCKWAYDASKGSLTDHHWNDEFLTQIGLADLITDNHAKLGEEVEAPGEAVGNGLSVSAAEELGLLPGTPVGTSLIDAHAGGIGMLICRPKDLSSCSVSVENKLGLICGTSSCHMAVSKHPAYIPGVWGPYFSAMVPGMWLNEGGQSATGKLIDHILETHPAYFTLKECGESFSTLSTLIEQLAIAKGVAEYQLTKDLHVYPDFHGNRSPLANPDMKGMICGLSLDASLNSLAVLYLATLQSLIYGTKNILEEMEVKGYDISTVYMCGGLTKNQLFVQMTADILNKPVVISDEQESVLVGAALLGMCASERKSLTEILEVVHCGGTVYRPDVGSQPYHCKKYLVFKRMCKDQLAYTEMMKS